jgi:hypothetical protein
MKMSYTKIMATFKAIIPQKLVIDPARLIRAIDNSLDMRAEDVRIDFQVTTQTWNKKPTFIIASKPGERRIYTSNAIYLFVSGGTKPHLIKPRNAPALAFFRTGFKPKTRVGYIGSNKGSVANKDFTKTQVVHHPGNDARDFDKVIAKKWKVLFPRLLQRAINAEASH